MLHGARLASLCLLLASAIDAADGIHNGSLGEHHKWLFSTRSHASIPDDIRSTSGAMCQALQCVLYNGVCCMSYGSWEKTCRERIDVNAGFLQCVTQRLLSHSLRCMATVLVFEFPESPHSLFCARVLPA